MSRFYMNIPDGTRDILFDDAKCYDDIINKLSAVYCEEGFQPIRTPAIEYYDAFDYRGQSLSLEEMVKIGDSGGRLSVLRADNTTPVARVIATKLKNSPLPIKLYYNQNVYRVNSGYSGKRSEIMQSGIEFAGSAGLSGDFQCVSTAIKALKSLGLPFKLEIGHVGFCDALIEEMNLTVTEASAVREYINSKNTVSLGFIKTESDFTKIKQLPRLIGEGDERAEILKKAELLADGNIRASGALSTVSRLYDMLEAEGYGNDIMIDLGIAQSMEYYTGIVFRAYIGGIGEPVLSGGRYDNLLSSFGYDIPAIGFAINVCSVADAMDAMKNPNVYKPSSDSGVIRIALTKGRIENGAVDLLKKAGYDCSELDSKGRKLLFEIKDTAGGDTKYEIVLAKAADVITYVEHGVCDAGIVGEDTIAENGSCLYEVLDLNYGKCRMALAGPKDVDFYDGYAHKVIASKYPGITRNYFNSKGMDVEVVKIDGSVELAPILGLSDAIVDVVETGSTLRENGLEVYEDVLQISARLVYNSAALKLKRKALNTLADRLSAVVDQAKTQENKTNA